MSGPKIFAHRGFRAIYPENTMLAFQKAIEQGVYGIELDVQLSRDGEIVIIHDETLDRTTSGSGYVKDHDYKALAELDAGCGERIPTLAEYFDLVRGLSIVTNIEFKNSVVEYRGMEEKVLNQVREFGLSDRLILSSFNFGSIKKLRIIAESIPCGVIVGEIYDASGLRAMMQDSNIEYLHPSVSCYLKHREAVLREGFLVNIWTVNDEAQARKLASDGVNGIFSDNPALLKKRH